MSSKSQVVNVDGSYNFPRGFTISDNRIEDLLQRYLTPAEYVVWRQYLRYWGSDKKGAYPSLSHLNKVTGLSEKTIRKCNKELSRKNFMTYSSGGPGRSNRYYYKPIEEIIAYYGAYKDDIIEETVKKPEPIIERGSSEDNAGKILSKLDKDDISKANKFVKAFKKFYLEKYGFEYCMEDKDARAVVNNINDLDKYMNLIYMFFKSKNKYIENSDRCMFFFFRPTVLKSIIAEYGESDRGRWHAQVEKIWDGLKDKLPQEKSDITYPETWIKENVPFSGANADRDSFVLSELVKRIARHYL